MQTLWAKTALTAGGWQSGLSLTIGENGRITDLKANTTPPPGDRLGVLLPAPTNLHSHAFQRAMAGMTEARGPDPRDTFWTWRKLMFRFLDHLSPDDIEAISAFVQMEMLQAGYAAVAEFHYIHHQPGGHPFDNIAELSERIASAAAGTGIGLTLLPVLYEHGGCDGRPLGPGQIRFGNTPEGFLKLFDAARKTLAQLSADCTYGVAPHSLRAVSKEGLAMAARIAPDKPIHMHIAEQTAEIEEVSAAWGQRPVDWLLSNHTPDTRWCLIHCTHMTQAETEGLARSGAVAGLCPITESSLGDGIFEATRYLAAQGRIGIGSDSNIRISLSEELRTLEYSQRLRDRGRAMLATERATTGRVLFESTAKGGAQAAGRDAGRIEVGALADLVALDGDAIDLFDKTGDALLDAFVFAGDDRMIRDVWSAGRHLVHEGLHKHHATITARYRKTLQSLKARI